MNHAVTPSSPSRPIHPDQTLAELAATWAGASRVFQRHGLDFCCRGKQSVAAACAERGIDSAVLLAELAAATAPVAPQDRWESRSTAALLAHVLDHYHARHREELPRLLQMAKKVEAVHGDRDECPRGLHAQLQHIAHELEEHMRNEEQVVFPLLLAGNFTAVHEPLRVVEEEHLEHGYNLASMRELARNYEPPADACGTWRALYLGLADLERDVMEHVHLENHVLFPRAGSCC
jgi:regulator of cell morphogenesis and NO signaling